MTFLLLSLLLGCSGTEQPEQAEAEVPEQCRNIHVDRLAGDWIAVRGKAADPKTRVRILEKNGGYEAWYIGGFFTRRVLSGEKREDDVRFTEVPDEAKKKSVEAGDETLVRLYLKPNLNKCAVEVYAGTVDGEGKEQIPPTGFELLPFPEQEGVTFAFQPPDETLFLGEAAKDPEVMAKQLEENGGPVIEHEMGTVPVGTFTDAAADGDPACTYDADLYFDDQLVTELSPKPAGEVVDGKRPWYHEWEAPYSGNHHFEMHRYRTCADGKRELIGVAALEAVLM